MVKQPGKGVGFPLHDLFCRDVLILSSQRDPPCHDEEMSSTPRPDRKERELLQH